MKRTHVLVLALTVFVFAPGCSVQDPDQPAVGSISIDPKPKAELGKSQAGKKALKTFGSPK